MRPPWLTRTMLVAVMIAALGTIARAEPAPPAPAPPAPAQRAYRIEGFRSARFGMDLKVVRAAAARDFNIEPAGMLVRENAQEQTLSLQAGVMRLNPGPGPAIVTYVFDRRNRRLVRVNVAWITATHPNDLQRQAMMNAGLRLQRYFHDQANDGGVMDADTLALYRARDSEGAEVAVTVSGVWFDRVKDGKATPSATPQGAAVLSVIYVRSP
jgi:hypothetical protein